jgi:hypothetical protein
MPHDNQPTIAKSGFESTDYSPTATHDARFHVTKQTASVNLRLLAADLNDNSGLLGVAGPYHTHSGSGWTTGFICIVKLNPSIVFNPDF